MPALHPRRHGVAALIAVVVVAALLALGAGAFGPGGGTPIGPAAAGAAHGKRCGTLGSYAVRARVVTCTYARTWVFRYLRFRQRARGYRCVRTSGRAVFYCTNGPTRAYWAERR